MVHRVSIEISGRTLTLETGRLAGLANGAVLVTYGETVVLTTVVTSQGPREGIDFFPLQVEFEEKMYAAGKIPGGFIKRESRPTENAILSARLTDRPIRPLFDKSYRNEVQVVSTVLSADQKNDPGLLSIIGASAALSLSDLTWHGPIGAVKLGVIEGEVVVNPTMQQLAYSDLDLTLAATSDALLMVEAGARELSEDKVLEALEIGHRAIQPIIVAIQELAQKAGKPKRELPAVEASAELKQELDGQFAARLEAVLYNPDKAGREDATRELRSEVLAHFADRFAAKEVAAAFDKLEKTVVRRNILEHGKRPDGRGTTEIRPISVEVGVLPRTHGSGLFTRGQTQALTVCTLGTTSDEQMLDTIGIETSKRYIHHYNFPPYSVGEARPMRGPGRRDIGHGALAERALVAVVPEKDLFPYTIRLVSEILSSNGSSSMASVCGSTLAMMDAGVPLKAPVAGIAMGLVTPPEGGLDRYAILTDIQGVEDALGDMDFKVAGTAGGITALQMDIKIRGITPQILREALVQAREARLFVLNSMLAVLGEHRGELSPFAPRLHRIKINPDRIRDVIGPGGKMIRRITEETKTTIDIEDDGTVIIGSTDATGMQRAIDIINGLTREVEAGQIYTGKVTRLMAFGAFVEIVPGKEGLVHISELADYRVNRVEDIVNVGDEVKVVVTEIDRQGRVNLSRRALLEPAPNEEEDFEDEDFEAGEEEEEEEEPQPTAPSVSRGPRDFGARRGGPGGGGAPSPGGGGFGRGPRREGPGRDAGGGGFGRGPRREGPRPEGPGREGPIREGGRDGGPPLPGRGGTPGGTTRRGSGGSTGGGFPQGGPRREGPGGGQGPGGPRREGPGGQGPGGPRREGPGGGQGPGGPRRPPREPFGPRW